MKFGNHEDWCNGPGDCSCGVDYREFADRCIDRFREGCRKRDKLHSDPKLLRKKATELRMEAKKLEGKT